MRRVLLDLPAQLGDVAPSPGASGLVQLLYVALRFLVLRGVLFCCKLPARSMTLLCKCSAPWTGQARQSSTRTYHHGAKDTPLALHKVAIHVQSCSSSNRCTECAHVCQGIPHVTGQRQRWSAPSRASGPIPAAPPPWRHPARP